MNMAGILADWEPTAVLWKPKEERGKKRGERGQMQAEVRDRRRESRKEGTGKLAMGIGPMKWDRIRLENREERREDYEGKQRDGKNKEEK